MTRLLASVRSAAEALDALEAGADLIDAKEPAHGALGALPADVVREIVAAVGGRRPVSATVGDLPLRTDALLPAAQRTAQCGVDLIKIGFFEGDDPAGVARALGAALRPARLVAVLFADRRPDFGLLPALARSGWHGVMLDTADKRGGTLRDHLDLERLGAFVARARESGLLTGLAGSLREGDVAPLAALGPHYLGFRGALCRLHRRGEALDARAIARIRAALARAPALSPLRVAPTTA
jgi:uncharacterized protein (UPF0264 family)